MDKEKLELYKNIINYYNLKCEEYLYGENRETLAIHAGFSDETTQEYKESLLRMNEVLADRAEICAGNLVLDAGCGVGGSAIWLAKNREANVIGISIVKQQIQYANQFAIEAGVDHLVHFLVSDFINTSFMQETFDVVWALESACYASDKFEFAKEAQRLLKPGGKLIVADGFQSSDNLSEEDEVLMQSWLSSWVVPHLTTPDRFFSYLRQLGFIKIQFEDISKNVLPFSLRLYLSALQSQAEIKKVNDWKELSTDDLKEIKGVRDQLRALSGGLWLYGIFLAYKPEFPPKYI